VLSKELRQTVVIDNKPGASGQIGTQAVKGAAPDGTTILCAVDHSLIIVPLTVPGVRYDAEADFVTLGLGARTSWALLLPPNAAYKDLATYAQAVKRDPQLRAYGVPLTGGAPGLIGDTLGRHAGAELTSVPYQGSAPVLQNVMAGQVPAGFTGLPEAIAAHRSGKARVAAVTGATRTPLLPDVPTFREQGIAGLEFVTFVGFFAPKGLAPAQAQAFNAALRKALADPAVQEKLGTSGLQPAPTTLEEAGREVAETERFWKTALGAKR
jgi:tripartite-type tricarboxylate transporter receptor subunit TctC